MVAMDKLQSMDLILSITGAYMIWLWRVVCCMLHTSSAGQNMTQQYLSGPGRPLLSHQGLAFLNYYGATCNPMVLCPRHDLCKHPRYQSEYHISLSMSYIRTWLQCHPNKIWLSNILFAQGYWRTYHG